MARREEIFSKLNMKDYNKYLEEVLETKSFASDVKSFLLSMIYKVETAYSDYSTVKNISKTKNEFLEEIIETIKNNCEKIELIKPSNAKYSELSNKKEKCIVNKKEIISLYNEQALLYAISKLGDKEYKAKSNVMKAPLQELLNTGKNIETKEIIRDFDGWAWHIEKKQIENITYNLVYQNLSMLIGNEIKTEQQLKDKLAKIYSKQDVISVYYLLCVIALKLYLENNEEEKKNFENMFKENKKELKLMEDRETYFKTIAEKKQLLEKRVNLIDKCLKNETTLKVEFKKAQESLINLNRTLTIEDFERIIQKQKVELLYEIQRYNQKMLEDTYTQEKNQLKENIKILSTMKTEDDIYQYILEFQNLFIVGLQIKIARAQTRFDIMKIIYNIRYYKLLPYQNKQVKDIKELKDYIQETEDMIYSKAIKMNVMNRISVNPKINNNVIRDILDTSIIQLENIELLFKAENYQITLEILDEGNTEKRIEYNTVEGLTLRMNKKIRLFIK